MVKKKVKRLIRKESRKRLNENSFEKELKKTLHGIELETHEIEKNIGKDVKEIESWVYHRRKFFLQLVGVIGIIACLIIILKLIAWFYLGS